MTARPRTSAAGRTSPDVKFGTLKPSGRPGSHIQADPSVSGAVGRSTRKYGNIPTIVDGVTFDSKKEAERYGTLRMLEQAGVIRKLDPHPRFPLVVHGQSCGDYEADFAYIDADGNPRVEDVKSPATRKLPTYRLKVKLLWALYGLRVEEV